MNRFTAIAAGGLALLLAAPPLAAAPSDYARAVADSPRAEANRTMDEGGVMLGDDVKVAINLELNKKAAQ